MLRFVFTLSVILSLSLAQDRTAFAQFVPAVAESDRELKDSRGPKSLVRFSFREAQWERVLKWLAEEANLTLDVTDLPPGSFNYVDDREHTIAEAIDAVNGYLLPRGYVVLRRNEFLVVLKTDNPILPNLIPTVPAEELKNYGNNELLRIIVSVPGFKPSEVAEQIEQFLGSQGKASPVDASEAVLLQGFGKSLRVATAVLSSAVAPAVDDELVFRSFPLKNIPAADAERQIQKLFGVGNNPFAESMARRAAYYSRRRDDDRRSESQQQPAPLLQNLSMNMKVSSLGRTNSLLVAATPSAITLVESILESIDVRPENGGEFLDDSTPVLKVYFVDEADEDDVAETINAIIPGVVLNEDGRHNAIHVYATALEHRQVENMIRTIDGGGAGGGVEVVPLYRTDPYAMGDLLTSLFANEDRDDRPVITPEFRTRSLVIRATSSQMAEIKKTLAAYGETGGLRSETAGAESRGSRFRKVSVPSGRAEWIARAVKDLLSEDREFGNPIRVVVPGEVSNEREPADDSIETDSVKTRRLPLPKSGKGIRVHEPGSVRGQAAPRTVFASTKRATAQSGCTVEPAQAESDSNPSPARPRVTIEVQNGELFMYSNDDSALNEIEDTIRELVRQMPARTNWTVFYLQSALAAETAEQLGQLLRDETDPYIGIGIPSTAESLPLGTQSVRIIPDSRTNALYISGPETKIQEAERFLELLDTNELPPSLRDRVPHIITVKHADVNEVATMIRELYKDYMEDPNDRRRSNRRDDRRDNDDDDRRTRVDVEREGDTPRQVGIRLTLAVDARASELIVSCNETLYQQIQEVVQSRDQAAVEAKPQIQIVNLHEETSQSIAESLNALSSKITIGTTAQPIRRSSSSSRDSSRSSSSRYDYRSRSRD